MARRPTVYDVAELAGVSIATVSFTFSRPERVKAETRDAVLAAADSVGYVPSASARGLARGRTGAIGLYAFDYLLEPSVPGTPALEPARATRLFPLYSDEVQRGVQLECRARGLALMLGSGRQPDQRPAVIDVAGRVDGLIAFAGAAAPASLQQVARRIPVVELGGLVRGQGMHTVLVDNGESMAELTRHLVSVHGIRTAAYLGDLGTPEFTARWEGFERTLLEAGLVPRGRMASAPGDDRSTVEALERVLAEGLPDAIVCSTDQEALVVLDELAARGLRAPDDVLVTGFDGIVAASLADPPLTTVVQPMEHVGRRAVEILVAALDGEGTVPESDVLPSALRIGRSCGCS